MIYLVYQTTPLFGCGIRPVKAYTLEKEAKKFCEDMNKQLDGYGYVAVPLIKGTQNAA